MNVFECICLAFFSDRGGIAKGMLSINANSQFGKIIVLLVRLGRCFLVWWSADALEVSFNFFFIQQMACYIDILIVCPNTSVGH